MKFAQIEFSSEKAAAQALSGIMRRGKISGLRDGSFIVPAPALDWLKENQIPYTLVRRLDQDDVLQTLRDPLACPV